MSRTIEGSDISVIAGTGFRDETPLPLVKLEISDHGQHAIAWMRPLEARMIGLDLIGAGHSAIADAELRAIAKRLGIDGDGLIADLRARTDAELGPG